MFDHTVNFVDADADDTRPVIIQKQCWTCFRMFTARVSTEVRCGRCLKAREAALNAPHNFAVKQTGEKFPILNAEPVPVIPDDNKQLVVSASPPVNSTKIINAEQLPIAVVRMDWIALRAIAPRMIKIGETAVDFSRCRMTRRGKVLHTTKNEWRMLALLCAEPGHIVPRFILATQIGYTENGRSIDTVKAILNKKLNNKIKALHGIGYYLEVFNEQS